MRSKGKGKGFQLGEAFSEPARGLGSGLTECSKLSPALKDTIVDLHSKLDALERSAKSAECSTQILEQTMSTRIAALEAAATTSCKSSKSVEHE